ncbi:MAG: hypothetical protein JWO07_183 [Candidatus Saccharibacteria bacterium]|nr:hypothetical protein [Candidatus Saccharibacteria bacterium]
MHTRLFWTAVVLAIVFGGTGTALVISHKPGGFITGVVVLVLGCIAWSECRKEDPNNTENPEP